MYDMNRKNGWGENVKRCSKLRLFIFFYVFVSCINEQRPYKVFTKEMHAFAWRKPHLHKCFIRNFYF